MKLFESITPLQERDSCLALAFLLLLIWCFSKWPGCIYASMAVLILGMIWPAFMKPFAWAWYGLAAGLGKVTSSILLALVWFLLVLPVGLVRRLLGKDPMRLSAWHKDSGSCFVDREHEYARADLEKPY